MHIVRFDFFFKTAYFSCDLCSISLSIIKTLIFQINPRIMSIFENCGFGSVTSLFN